jgi:hypothetical protein
VGERVTLLDEDLMTDSSPCWEEVDTMTSGECLDAFVFLKVFGGFVLDVVVESKNWLGGIPDALCADGVESKLCY